MPTTGRHTRIGRLFGIPIEISASWILLSILALWSFWTRYTTIFDHRTDGVAVMMAFAATILLLGSILLHELGHGLAGRHRGLRVWVVTLYFYGGATSASDPSNPVDEFVFTLIGPLVNLVLALALWGITGVADREHFRIVSQVTGEAAWLNLLLGAFNLIPAAPLDGGHLLEAAVWRVSGDRAKAIRVAARAGAGLGGVLMPLGVLELLIVHGGLFEGLWLGVIGYILFEGAKSEMARAWVEGTLREKPAGMLLTEHAQPVTRDTSVRWLAHAELLRHHVDAVPVEENGITIGVVLAGDVLGPTVTAGPECSAIEVMHPLGDLPTERVDAPAIDVLHLLGDHPLVVLVDRDDHFVGAVSQRQVGLVLERLRSIGTFTLPPAVDA